MSDPSRVKLEIVDDDPLATSILALALESKDFEVTVRNSGAECLECLDPNNLPDLILLDVKMPPPDGIATLGKIREQWDMSTLPVILFTGMEESEVAVLGFKGGANDFIHKPVDIEELCTRVGLALRRS